MSVRGFWSWCCCLMVLIFGCAHADEPALRLTATVPMPNVKGRIDHFGVDVAGHRLFVAALGNNTLEVVDVERSRRERSITGFGEPQGVLHLRDRVYVANGNADRVDILDAKAFSVLKRIAQLGDADNVRLDPSSGSVWVGYGSGALREMDANGETLADIALGGHPESFQLERHGSRAFVNVPSASQVAVVDRKARTLIAAWPLGGASGNFPMALDEQDKRLFVGARSPAVMLVFDTETGSIVGRLPVGSDTDDLFFDVARHRVYVVCGEGRVDVFRQETPDRYVHQTSIKTAPRARTGLFVPEHDRLYVAAPASSGSPARILVYQVQ